MKEQKFVKITTHGVLGDELGHKTWNLCVKSVSQAINAIEVLSKRKLYKFLLEQDKKGLKYQVLINGRDFLYDENNPPNIKDLDSIKNTELCAKIKNLETIDIVPVLEGAGGNGASIGAIILGVVLIIVGIVISPFAPGLNVALVIAGIGLIAAGVTNLLTKGPDLTPFKEKTKTSYLFNGPANTINEGAPVPVGYGRLIIGSSPIFASYDIESFDADEQGKKTSSGVGGGFNALAFVLTGDLKKGFKK